MERTLEQIREHYEIEKELASKLKHSTQEERKYLYKSLYDELYKRVLHHPQLTRRVSLEESKRHVFTQMNFLKRFLKKNLVFAEIGPGDCALSFDVAELVSKVYAIDVSEEISKNEHNPKNFQLILSDGKSIPLPKNSVDLVYSNQLMEHLHPEDAREQLENIVNILKVGGKYICITPNRINGPHDISSFFDKEASGFHLKEYTFTELKKTFKDVGFTAINGYWGVKGKYIKAPTFIISFVEQFLSLLPVSWRRKKISEILLDIRIVGIK